MTTPRQFHFERQWIKQEGFLELVEAKWADLKIRWPEHVYSMDKWHGGIGGLRQFLRGWGNNLRWEHKRAKREIIRGIEEIDSKINGGGG